MKVVIFMWEKTLRWNGVGFFKTKGCNYSVESLSATLTENLR